MIQRIQTLYFFIIVVLSSIGFFLPVANLYDPFIAELCTIKYQGITCLTATGGEVIRLWPLLIIATLIPLIALVTIFLYKKRVLQIRLSFINMILMLGFYVILFLNLWQSTKGTQISWSLNIAAAFPLVSMVLNWLAIRAIGKDEALVKSLNRLR